MRNFLPAISRDWLARLLIGLVIAWNLQAAFAFYFSPGAFAPGFELNGVPGAAAVRGIAILFVMWNVPYLAACWNPSGYLTSLKEAIVMQAIGLTGETAILLNIPSGHVFLQTSIQRFIAFDAAGLAALGMAFWLVNHKKLLQHQP